MTVLDAFKYIGIEVPVFIAGSSGAIVFLTKSTKMTRAQYYTTILAGGLSANYLTPLVGNWIGFEQKVFYGLAFLVGFGGMKLVGAIFEIFFNKVKSNESR